MTIRRFLLAMGFLSLLPMTTYAAGFAFYEAGAKAVGMSGAFTATADDPSAMYYNPAGLAFQEGKLVMMGGTLVAPSYNFTGANPYPGEGVTEKGKRQVFLPPSLYYRHPISDRVVLGIGAFMPFGLGTEWENPETYSGRFLAKKTDLKSLTIQPTIAYKVHERLGIGFGLDIRESKVDLLKNQPFLNPYTGKVIDLAELDLGSDWSTSVGFSLGVLAKPIDNWRVGFSYRHDIDTEFDGKATFTFIPTGNPALDAILRARVPQGERDVTTAIHFPREVSFGVATTAIPKTTVEIDINWTGWSSFDQLVLDFTDLGTKQVIKEDYQDCFNYRFGVERLLSEKIALRGGYYYDETPQPIETTGPMLPDANRHGFNFGLGYKMGKWTIDGAALILLFQERSTVEDGVPKNRDGYNGTYENKAFIMSFNVSYAF